MNSKNYIFHSRYRTFHIKNHKHISSFCPFEYICNKLEQRQTGKHIFINTCQLYWKILKIMKLYVWWNLKRQLKNHSTILVLLHRVSFFSTLGDKYKIEFVKKEYYMWLYVIICDLYYILWRIILYVNIIYEKLEKFRIFFINVVQNDCIMYA